MISPRKNGYSTKQPFAFQNIPGLNSQVQNEDAESAAPAKPTHKDILNPLISMGNKYPSYLKLPFIQLI